LVITLGERNVWWGPSAAYVRWRSWALGGSHSWRMCFISDTPFSPRYGHKCGISLPWLGFDVIIRIIMISMLMPIQQYSFTHLSVLLVLTDRGTWSTRYLYLLWALELFNLVVSAY
jgi:hypothetical protein